MNRLIKRYLFEEPHFEDALILSEQTECHWEDVQTLCPLPKSWFELSRLPVEDRIDFTKQFWLKTLPYRASLFAGIERFFQHVDDVGPVLLLDRGWQPRFFYSLKGDATFFCGNPPVEEEELKMVVEQIDFPFPGTWQAFMRIHNGFGKLLDRGLIPCEELDERRQVVMEKVLELPVRAGGRSVDPEALFPFYEGPGWSAFHCFFADWLPEGEIGTVYFSGIDDTISNTRSRNPKEVGAYPSFGEWLVAFLEGAEMIL